jgi:hypothetical protein
MVSVSRLDCGTSWIKAAIGSTTIKLVFVASTLSTQHYEERTQTGPSESG